MSGDQGLFREGGSGKHRVGICLWLRVPRVVWALPGCWLVGFALGTAPQPALPDPQQRRRSIKDLLCVVDYFYFP